MLRCFGFGSSNIHGSGMGAIPEKIKIPVEMDGTTEGSEKWPLILKDFFEIKTAGNEKSITQGGWSYEDGVSAWVIQNKYNA